MGVVRLATLGREWLVSFVNELDEGRFQKQKKPESDTMLFFTRELAIPHQQLS
jgi:hypothetical protein